MAKRKARDISAPSVVAGSINPKMAGPLKAYSPIHSTIRKPATFDFSRCEALGTWANIIADEFIIFSKGYGSIKSVRAVFIAVRLWVDALVASVPEGQTVDWNFDRFRRVSNEWAISNRNNQSLKETTRAKYRSDVILYLRHLFKKGVLRPFELLGEIKNPVGGKKPPISETPRRPPRDGEVISNEVIAAFTTIEGFGPPSDTEGYLKRLNYFVDRTKHLCERKAREYWNDFQEAQQEMQSQYGLDAHKFLNEWMVSEKPLRFRRGWKEEIKSKGDALRLFLHFHPEGLLVPSKTEQVLMRLIYEKFGAKGIRQLLHSVPSTAVPFLGLILLDVANEVSSSKTMTDGSMTKTDDGAVIIKWFKKRANKWKEKRRANGFKDALQRDSILSINAEQSMECLDVMRQRLIPYAIPEEKDCLFLVGRQKDTEESVELLSDAAQIHAWKRLTDEDEVLSHYPFTLDKIRSTMVLKVFLESGGDIMEVARVALHSLNTAVKYVNEKSANFQKSRTVRTMQDHFLLDAVKNREDILNKLGIDEDETRKIIDEARRSRAFLEYFPDDDTEQIVSDVVSWLVGGEKMIIGSPRIAAQIIAYRQHILDDIELRLDDEWETMWAPLLIMLNITVHAFSPKIRVEGQKLASEYKIRYFEVDDDAA